MILNIEHTNQALEGGDRLFTVTVHQYEHVMDGDGDIRLIRPYGDPFTADVRVGEEQMLDIFSSDKTEQILDGIRSELLIHALQEMN